MKISSMRILFLLVILVLASVVNAVPADPCVVTMRQPDGTYVNVVLHGDEWQSFYTTEDGYTIVMNSDGFFVYAFLEKGKLKASQVVAHNASYRHQAEQSFLSGVSKYQVPEMTAQTARKRNEIKQKCGIRRCPAPNDPRFLSENFRGLVILVEFNDRKFSRDDSKAIFNDIINKENYTGFDEEEYTGSVRDYFYDNSGGKFSPQFDIYGPYAIDYSQYDARYEEEGEWQDHYNELAMAAVNAVDADVNFQDYDGDDDGFVETVDLYGHSDHTWLMIPMRQKTQSSKTMCVSSSMFVPRSYMAGPIGPHQ